MPSLGVADKGAHLPSRATVFLFLGVRAYRSDLLRTRYVRYLSERYRVVVFLREQEELGDLRKEYYQSEHVTYIVCSEPQSRFWLLFDVFLRNELIRRFDGNPAVRWRNPRVRDRRRLFLRRLSRFLPTRLLTPSFFFFLERHLFPGYRAFRRYAREYRPALILTATPGLAPFDLYAILCAKRAGIPSVAVNMGLDNLTIYPRHVRPVDYLIVWNRMNKEQALRWHGFREEQVFISGAVRFDHYFISSPREMTREAFLQSKGLDPNRKTVLYAAKTYGTFYKNFIRRFVEWQNTDPRFASLNLFVRVHPIDSLADFEEFFGIPNVHIERASATLRQPDFMKGHKVEMDEEDLINTKETMTLLSMVRLGVDMGLINDIDRRAVNELFILTQPAHLQKIEGRPLSSAQRDVKRANLVRRRLEGR